MTYGNGLPLMISKKKLLKNVKRNFHVFLCLIIDVAFKVEPKIYFIKTWLKAIEIKDLLLKKSSNLMSVKLLILVPKNICY